MISNKWIKLAIVLSTITLAACSTTHKRVDNAAVDDANAAYANTNASGAQTSGVGQNASFNDQSSGTGMVSRRQANQRVYYFDFDSNVVHDSDKPAIYANANYLLTHGRAKVLLEGHTDPRGSREYNVGLGERRAKAVADILTAKGVSPSQIRVLSYGAQKLAVPGRTEADYQQDRRVVLVYLQQ